jgi:predicted transcriptional regulator
VVMGIKRSNQPMTYHVKLDEATRKQVSNLAEAESRTIHNMLQRLIARGIMYSEENLNGGKQ